MSVTPATRTDLAELVVVSAIWGSSFLCIAIALDDLAPLEIAAWRLGLAAVLLLALIRWRGLSIPTDRRSVTLLLVIGALNGAIPFTLISWGQQSVASSTTAILIATSPFTTLALSHLMSDDERFGWSRLAGLSLGFTGILVLFGEGLAGGAGAGSSLPGMLAIVLAASCYALSAILIRRLKGVPGLSIVAGTLSAGALMLLPLLLVLHPPWQARPGVTATLAVVFLALGPTALAYVMRTRIVQRNGAVFMSSAGYLIPLFAVLWGWLFLHERPTLRVFIALSLVIAGIAVGQWRSYTERLPATDRHPR